MKLNEIKKLSEFMEILDWHLDGHGMAITNWYVLTDAVMNTFPELEDDVTPNEESD